MIWNDQTGGNHYLFSIIHKLTTNAWRTWNGLPSDAFNETVSRLPLLVAGLGSIIAIALFLNWLGRPHAGLFAAFYLAIHPWHIRYSTEAKGYMLMLLFFILAVWALLHALRSGTWKAWIQFAIMELLAIYSWKIAILPFSAINGSLILWLLFDKRHDTLSANITTLTRLILVNLTAGAAFIFLVMPCTLQSPRAIQHIRGKPMDQKWLENSICGILTGNRWHRDASDNPTEQPLSEVLAASPGIIGMGLASTLTLIAVGFWAISRTRPEQAIMFSLILCSAAVGMGLFKWFIRIEWIYWYSFFTLFPLAIFTALGMDALHEFASQYWRKAQNLISKGLAIATYTGVAIAPAASFAVTLPQTRLILSQPNESYRETFQLTRGRHEQLGFTRPSNVLTCYIWRHIETCDPRADWHVRDAQTLEAHVSSRLNARSPLFHRQSARPLCQHEPRPKSHVGGPTAFRKNRHPLGSRRHPHQRSLHYLGSTNRR